MPKLSDIARELGIQLHDTPDREVRRIASLDDAGPDDLSYVASDRYLDRLARTRAGVVLAPRALELPATTAVVLRVADAELAIGRSLELFAPPAARPARGVHPTAAVAPDAVLGQNVAVGSNVSIAAGAVIGNGVTLHPNVVVGPGVIIGDDCELFAGVVLRERVVLGNRVLIHANAVIGSDGFGYRWDGKRHVKIPQIGTVVLEDDVEVGSCTCIDRAKFGETRIGRGTKIDNLVQVGHNVRTGAHCILCGQTGIAGSTTLGNNVVMGGGSAAKDHVNIADGTMVAARGGIGGDTKPGEVLAGSPAVPHRDWLKERVTVQRLPELLKQVKRLEEEVAKLKEERKG